MIGHCGVMKMQVVILCLKTEGSKSACVRRCPGRTQGVS